MNNQFGVIILCLLLVLALIIIVGFCFLMLSYGIEYHEPSAIIVTLVVLSVIWLFLSYYIYFSSYIPTATWL